MEKNISPAGMTCIVLVAVASVVGVSYASFAITRNSANEGNQEVVTQAEAATTSWTSTYNGKSVTGSQVVNLLNNADSRGISVFISTRGIERELTTTNNTPVLKHNGKYYVNYGTTYNYEDSSYGYVEGEANYTGDSALLQVRDGQSLKTNYSPKFDNSTIVKNKDFSAAYNVGSPTYIESTAKFDANLIYGPDGEVTGVILSQSTKATAATSVQLGSSSGGGFVNGSGAMGGTSGSYIPTHSNSGNIPLASASNNGTVAGGTVTKVPSNSKPANNLKQETNYGVSDKLDINQEGAVKVDVSAIDETGLGFVAIKVSDETPTEKQLLTEQYMLYLKYDIPGLGNYENISYIYDDRLQGNGDFLYYEDEWPFVVVNKNNANVMGLEIPEKGMYLLYPQNIKEMGGTFEYTIEKKQFVQFYLDGVPYKGCPDEDIDHWAGSAYAPEGGYFDAKDMYHLGDKLFTDFKNGDYPVDGKNYISSAAYVYFTIDGVNYKADIDMIWVNWMHSSYCNLNLYSDNTSNPIGLMSKAPYYRLVDEDGSFVKNKDIVKNGANYKLVYKYSGEPVINLANTSWTFKDPIGWFNKFEILDNFDFENQTGWEDFPRGSYVTNGKYGYNVWGMTTYEFNGIRTFGFVTSVDTPTLFIYVDYNDYGIPAGWYEQSSEDNIGVMTGQITSLEDVVSRLKKTSNITFHIGSGDDSVLKSPEIIDMLYHVTELKSNNDVPISELSNTSWKLNARITDYDNSDIWGIFDFENQTGWEDFPRGCYITDGVATLEFWGLAMNECFGYRVLGTVQAFSADWSFSYLPKNDLGFEEGWYRCTGESARALCNGEITLDNLDEWKSHMTPCNPPTIKFSSDLNSALENERLINWLYVNGALK